MLSYKELRAAPGTKGPCVRVCQKHAVIPVSVALGFLGLVTSETQKALCPRLLALPCLVWSGAAAAASPTKTSRLKVHTSPCGPSPLGPHPPQGLHPVLTHFTTPASADPPHPPPGLAPMLTHWPPPQRLLCLLWQWGCTPGQQEGGETPPPSPALPRAQMLLWPQAAIKEIDRQAFGQVKPSRRKIHVSS